MTASKIEWTDRSDWNPVRGCTRVSPGCGGPGKGIAPGGGCYAEAIAARFSAPGQPFHGFAERTSKGPRWTGKVAVQWDRLDLPLRWKVPARIFASSTSDFFHGAFSMGDVAELFGVMIAAVHHRGHTFQVLTKRAARMREMLADPEFWEHANAAASMHVMDRVDPLARRSDDARATLDDYGPANPPPGIWLGVSVEDQARADERIPDLLATPAAVRFLSCEPLLGPVDLKDDSWSVAWMREVGFPGIDWVIAGGESGPGARAMHPDWARGLRDQCVAAGVPFHFKQWGEWLPCEVDHDDYGKVVCYPEDGSERDFPDLKGTRPIKQLDRQSMWRIGKKLAGRLLDGVTHDGFPA